MKILLAEDEPDLSFALAKGLKQKGYAVDSAFDGEEVLQYYHQYDYDLIILGILCISL